MPVPSDDLPLSIRLFAQTLENQRAVVTLEVSQQDLTSCRR
jgi:hypothetical protein